MKELVEFLAKNIADQEDSVKVATEKQDAGEKITLTVAPEDMGKIIGKSGRIIKAIRTILRIKAIKEGKRVYLELADQTKENQLPGDSKQQ